MNTARIIVALLAITATSIGAQPTKKDVAKEIAACRSIGSPSAGHLESGIRLPELPTIRIIPSTKGEDARWGLKTLVDLLQGSAHDVALKYPGTQTSIGHLSLKDGGDILGHASHESGRDADVQFFVKDAKGQVMYADHYVPFRGDGTAPAWHGAIFDDEKNWIFIKSVLLRKEARVSHIFVAAPIRARLLHYAQRIGESASLRALAEDTLQPPSMVLPHDDHFHIRISCPPGMTTCVENPKPRRQHQTTGRAKRKKAPVPGTLCPANSDDNDPMGG